MSFIGNLIWLVFGGILGAVAWFAAGLLLCITVILARVGFSFGASDLF
jgi:uncharacterized membrane protein YccF (DUF307 family)